MTPAQREAIEAYEKHGSTRAAAIALGISRGAMRSRLEAASRDPAIDGAMQAVGTGLVPAMAWVKTAATDTSPAYSVLLKPAQDAPEDAAERIRAALEGMEPAKPVAMPDHHDDDLLTVYPLADCHVGAMAWHRETGEDYDTAIAVNRIREWVGRAVDASPASGHAVILDVGDLTHADDQTNQTPRSRHQLDVDTRHFRTLEVTIAALAYAVEYALQKHAQVTVRILPGNHNVTSFMTIVFALAERYRNEPRVTVEKNPSEFWVMQFGDCLFAAHHGHGGKPERMVLFLADEYAQIWGATRHRVLYTGHLHHLKAADIGGCTWEQLRALTARDAYAVSNAFSARAQLQGITYHRTRGEVMRVKVAQ